MGGSGLGPPNSTVPAQIRKKTCHTIYIEMLNAKSTELGVRTTFAPPRQAHYFYYESTSMQVHGRTNVTKK